MLDQQQGQDIDEHEQQAGGQPRHQQVTSDHEAVDKTHERDRQATEYDRPVRKLVDERHRHYQKQQDSVAHRWPERGRRGKWDQTLVQDGLVNGTADASASRREEQALCRFKPEPILPISKSPMKGAFVVSGNAGRGRLNLAGTSLLAGLTERTSACTTPPVTAQQRMFVLSHEPMFVNSCCSMHIRALP